MTQTPADRQQAQALLTAIEAHFQLYRPETQRFGCESHDCRTEKLKAIDEALAAAKAEGAREALEQAAEAAEDYSAFNSGMRAAVSWWLRARAQEGR